MLTKGGDITIQTVGHNTPIHRAFYHFSSDKGGDIDTLMYLLNQKGIDFKNQNGYTLLLSACANIFSPPSFDIIKYLIESKGVRVDCLDEYGNTPVHLLMLSLSHTCQDFQVSQTVEYLIKKGGKINHENQRRKTALDVFSPYNSTHPLTYTVLIKNGAKYGKDC
jgi:ankyrin repeat protein